MHKNSTRHFLKICTWWPLVTLTWFWPLMMSKMHFLCIGVKKYTFWKFALDDLWWPWPYFDLPWCLKSIFCAYELKNTLFENLHLMNLGDLGLILTSCDVQNAFSVHRNSKIEFLKNCTWWPLVTWLWPPVMIKILFLCIGAQKYTFWKFALDDLW